MKERIIALSSVWGGEVAELFCKESPFENLNNLTQVEV